jgi:hypothetical protein
MVRQYRSPKGFGKKSSVGTKKWNNVPCHPEQIHYRPPHVVTPVLSMTSGGPIRPVKLYVLLNQKAGLCSLYNIHQDEVFYFDEPRTAALSNEARSSSWNQRVRAQVLDEVARHDKLTINPAIKEDVSLTVKPSFRMPNGESRKCINGTEHQMLRDLLSLLETIDTDRELTEGSDPLLETLTLKRKELSAYYSQRRGHGDSPTSRSNINPPRSNLTTMTLLKTT